MNSNSSKQVTKVKHVQERGKATKNGPKNPGVTKKAIIIKWWGKNQCEQRVAPNWTGQHICTADFPQNKTKWENVLTPQKNTLARENNIISRRKLGQITTGRKWNKSSNVIGFQRTKKFYNKEWITSDTLLIQYYLKGWETEYYKDTKTSRSTKFISMANKTAVKTNEEKHWLPLLITRAKLTLLIESV